MEMRPGIGGGWAASAPGRASIAGDAWRIGASRSRRVDRSPPRSACTIRSRSTRRADPGRVARRTPRSLVSYAGPGAPCRISARRRSIVRPGCDRSPIVTRPPGVLSLVLAATVLLGLPAPLSAQVAPPSFRPPRKQIEGDDFEPRPPGFSGPDWIQLVSGEWLQGSVDRIRNDSLEFDSDELDDLSFDLEDVYAVVTAGPHTLSFEGRQVVTGEVAIRGYEIRIRTPEGIRSFTRDEIVGMVPGLPREANYWRGKISLGLSLQRGNTNTVELTGLGDVTRETALTRANAKYNGTISSVGAVTTANNHRVTGQGDIFVTRRFYVTVVYLEYFTDEFQNVDLRLTPAVGIGYDLVERSRLEATVTLATGAQYTRNVTPPQFSTDRDR
ncbi:MAG TPA: DUF481 domain-containing protein, partial [Alphaproteobacteria bacterium]|nr:DUF481 domain-containing protein [Alphaproteobacteria bacterium]